ncbi:MAG: DUF547 domain-containing protein [Candidatus Obscuribacter sp.]|nr:DUF547 domain-containing protein [Candidatus Obscuribacter sp.]
MSWLKNKIAISLLLSTFASAHMTQALAGQVGKPSTSPASAAAGSDSTTQKGKSVDKKIVRHFDQDYKAYARELSQYVEFGNVHYNKWKAHQIGLDKFLKAIEHLDPKEYETFSRDEKLAFWLNTYNALTIKTVLDYYPIHGTLSQYPPDSFRQIPNDWESVQFKVMGSGITLYAIEHEKIRRDLADPRTHFAEVCASRSCAQITKEPFIGAKLQTQLDDATRRFMADSDNILIDPAKDTFMASKIFSWFTLDFAPRGALKPVSGNAFAPPQDEDIIADYVTPFLSDSQKKALAQVRQAKPMHFDYLPYDWALNDADNAGITKN